MDVITFEAATDKGVIQIPEKYLKSVTHQVQVILVFDKEIKTPKKSKVRFSALSIDTKNIKFTRDEANER